MVDIFRELFIQDFDDVVDRDDSDHLSIVIHDRESRVAVFPEGIGDVFLVIGGVDRNHLCIHDLFDRRIERLHDQVSQGDNAPERIIFLVDYVHIIAGFGVDLCLQVVQGPHDGIGRVDGDELGRHDTAGGIFLILQQLRDVCFGPAAQQGGYDGVLVILFQFLDQVGNLVHAHPVQDRTGAVRIHDLQDLIFIVVLRFVDDVSQEIVRKSEQIGIVSITFFLDRFQYVRRMRLVNQSLDVVRNAACQQPYNGFVVSHGSCPPSVFFTQTL